MAHIVAWNPQDAIDVANQIRRRLKRKARQMEALIS